MIRNVIFDWSGTLVDDLPAVWRASNILLTRAGRPELSLEDFRASFSLPFRGFYERQLPDIPLDTLERWFHEVFEQVQSSVVELPHARDFLEFCRANSIRTALLSSIHRRQFAEQVARIGFDQWLDHTCIEAWDKRQRVHELLANAHMHPGETLLVGDMEHDIETAHHAGLMSCAVLTGYNNLAQLRAARPHLIVEHLGELRRILTDSAFDPAKHAFFLARNVPADPGTKDSPAPHPYPIPTVGALIFNSRGDVLMIRTHKWSDLWGIPGGKIQHGESSLTALHREVLEETGLRISGVEFVMVQDCIHPPEFYRPAHFLLLNYTCWVDGPETPVILNEEAQLSQWIPPREALNLPLNHPTRVLLEAVLEKPTPGRAEPWA